VDDPIVGELVIRSSMTSERRRALADGPRVLRLTEKIQRAAWDLLLAEVECPIRTSALAQRLRVSREHLSRQFGAGGAPNLKRVIDLVRLIAAAELAKNPGYDVRDVAEVLDFASSSHLSSTAQRIVGTKPTSLARLRAVDLVDRFTRGHGRSRG